MTTLKPLHDRVLLKREKSEATTKSGLYLPDTAQNPSREATVIAIGPGDYNHMGVFVPTTLKPGTTVLIPLHGGTDIKIDGEEFSVIREGEILAEYEPAEEGGEEDDTARIAEQTAIPTLEK